jgi:uncharacterized protein YciI
LAGDKIANPTHYNRGDMKIAAIVQYTPDTSLIAKVRPAHRQYLTSVFEQGKIVMSGPFTDDRGALMVYEAANAEEVEAIIAADPFAQSGVFVSWELRPWNVIFTNKNLL